MKKYNPQIAIERGSRLKEEIRNRGLTQGEVAESLDMSLSGLTYLLSGRSQINRTMAFALEFKFNIGSDWILEGKGLRLPQVFLRLDPWERMIIERNDKNFEKHNLDLILRGFEQDERNNQMLTYTSFAYIEGEISLEEKSEIDRKLGVGLDEHQKNRRNFFEHLFHGIPMEVKDSEKDSVISQRIRKIWRNVRPKDSEYNKNQDSGLLVLDRLIKPLMMYLHYGESEWNRIKENSSAFQQLKRDQYFFYQIAVEGLKDLEKKIKDLITPSEEQTRFIELAKPKHISSVGAMYLSDDELDQLFKTHNKGDANGIDG